MTWTANDWNLLATLFDGACPLGPVSRPDGPLTRPYAGYRPAVVEAPNGDTKRCPCTGKGGDQLNCDQCHGTGRVPNTDVAGVCGCCEGRGTAMCCGMNSNAEVSGGVCFDCGAELSQCDACNGTGRTPGKRYLHVGAKDLAKHPGLEWPREYHDRAFAQACRVATALGVPAAYRPHEAYGALRVLDYPPGAGTVEHTDPDLFTIVLWRSTPEDLERLNPAWSIGGPRNWHPTVAGRLTNEAEALIRRREAAHAMSPGLHIGEIGELAGLGPATPHRVPARPYAQKSIIYFAIPDHAAILPPVHVCDERPCRMSGCDGGQTVGAWLAERMARSRYEASR